MSYIFFKNKKPHPLTDAMSGLKQIFHTPIISATVVLVMTFSLLLTTLFYVLRNSEEAVRNRWNESAEISLYLKKKVDTKTATEMVEKLRQNNLVAKAEIIKAQEGIKAFAGSAELKMLLSSFKENPLPTVITIYPKVKMLSTNVALGFIQELKNQTAVETVKADMAWIERSYNWLNLCDNLSLIFILVLSTNAFLIIGGTNYLLANFFITKKETPKEIIPYKSSWLSLISCLLAIFFSRSIIIMLQNHGILIQNADFSFEIFIILSSLLLGFVSAKMAAAKNR